MKTASHLASSLSLPRPPALLPAFALALALTTGCNSGSSPYSAAGPTTAATTPVTVLLSSSVNDQLSKVFIGFSNVTLTSQSGNTITLYTGTQTNGIYSGGYEFIHLNGSAEPLATVNVRQDVYTSAAATVVPGSNVNCVTYNSTPSPGTLTTYSNTQLKPGTINVSIPTPITVSGTAMGISLNLTLPPSALSACTSLGSVPMGPSFNAAPVTFSPQPTNSDNGKETNLEGQISSVNSAGNSFKLVLADGETLAFNSNASTVYQGISGFSALVVGTVVDMDAAIQSNGSQLATRVAVPDTDTANLTVMMGPVLASYASVPVVLNFPRQQQGALQQAGGVIPFSIGDAAFGISRQFTNLQELPFPVSFDTAHIFGGQNVYITTHALTFAPEPTYLPASTVTLMPQTIDGTVTETSSSGSFQIYSVSLASYDLPPVLALQPGLSYALNSPGAIEVYVDGSTQLLNRRPLAAGGVFRFTGLLFNDDGTMRMDCAQVSDGVTQ